MNKDQLKEVHFDQKETFKNRVGIIPREIVLDFYTKSSQVIVITGVRRCGKSSLLYLIKEKMGLTDKDFCYFNFDDERIVAETDILDKLLNLHREVYGVDPVFFFDEIQNISGWEKFVNRVYEKGIKVFVTGSNASLLSSEISSSLTGRNLTIELLPFSFGEYLSFRGINFDLSQLSSKQRADITGNFDLFFKQGGFPLVVKEVSSEILIQYFQDILYRDIIARHRIGQVGEIRQMAIYLFSNISKIFSYSNLQKIAGIKSSSTTKTYLELLGNSFLLFYLQKFDFSVKKQMMNPRKVFSIDQGLTQKIGFNFTENKGRILENIVYLELRRRKQEVFYFSGKHECDFVVRQGIQLTQAIQVTYLLSNENADREINGLLEVKNNFGVNSLLLLVYDGELNIHLPDSITVTPVWKWLLER